jgi:hypothetical protein
MLFLLLEAEPEEGEQGRDRCQAKKADQGDTPTENAVLTRNSLSINYASRNHHVDRI